MNIRRYPLVYHQVTPFELCLSQRALFGPSSVLVVLPGMTSVSEYQEELVSNQLSIVS